MTSYRVSMLRRLEHQDRVEHAGEEGIALELERCRRSCAYLLDHWGWTYDPRNAALGLPTYLPFDMWPKQRAYLSWLDAMVAAGKDGLAEKSRDAGFTWLSGAWAWHKYRFVPGFKTTFGSRKEKLVDTLGDPDSIFEKIRIFTRRLPRWMLPVGFDSRVHDNHLRLINPENENTISGEGGDEMGRGGRCTAYIFDEYAFVERADRVDAATSATAQTRIFGSSVNGVGNNFYRKRHGGGADGAPMLAPDQIFVFDVADDPRKTPEWIETKKNSMEEHVWASEYGRDYTASVEGICIPGKYVEASFRLRELIALANSTKPEDLERLKKLPRVEALRGTSVEPEAAGIGGLDVGGGGKAKSVAIARFGPIVTIPLSWGDPDTNETAARCLDYAEKQKPTRSNGLVCAVKLVNFDSVGVGHGALGVMTRGRKGIVSAGINTGVPPSDRTWPDGLTSIEKFANLKAEIWFLARERLKNTFELVLWLEGKQGGQMHPFADCMLLPAKTSGGDSIILVGQLSSVKWLRNEVGKFIMESKASLTKRGIASPDHAEALVLTMIEDNVLAQWRKAFG